MKTFIHIGYHKTGSSWLQRLIHEAEKANRLAPIDYDTIIRNIVDVNALDFDARKSKEALENSISNKFEHSAIPVMSCERLSGNPHSGGYDTKELAYRLRETTDNAQVLIVIREQKDIIRSCYRQYVKVGGTCTLKKYLNPPTDTKVPLFSLDHFRYDRTVALYMNLFGAENVKVVTYESLRNDPRKFISDINNFLSDEKAILDEKLVHEWVNKSLSAFSLKLLRLTNPLAVRNTLTPCSPVRFPGLHRILVNVFYKLDFIIPNVIKNKSNSNEKKIINEHVGNYYRKSNKELMRLTNLELDKYGYGV